MHVIRVPMSLEPLLHAACVAETVFLFVQVTAMWDDTVGALLNTADCSTWTLEAIMQRPRDDLLACLPEAGSLPQGQGGSAPPASGVADPRLSDRSMGLGLLYQALAVLHPADAALQQVQPRALLSADGMAQVEAACRQLQWALLYAPQRVPLWLRLAAFYEQAADAGMRSSAMHLSPQARSRSEAHPCVIEAAAPWLYAPRQTTSCQLPA